MVEDALAAKWEPDAEGRAGEGRQHAPKPDLEEEGPRVYPRTLDAFRLGVIALCALPDGRRVVAAGREDDMQIWDVGDGRRLAVLEGHRGEVFALCALRDGKRVVSASEDTTLKVWEVDAHACLSTLNGHKAIVRAVCALPDGKRVVSASEDASLIVWDVDAAACLRTLNGYGEPGAMKFGVCALRDGKRVVSASDDSYLRVWDVDGGTCLRTLEGHEAAVSVVCALPDGKRVVSTSHIRLKVWDVDTGSCIASMNTLNFYPTLCALPKTLGGCGLFVSGSLIDNAVRVWSIVGDRCKCVAKLTDRPSWQCRAQLQAVCALPNGRQVVTGSDATSRNLEVWPIPTFDALYVCLVRQAESCNTPQHRLLRRLPLGVALLAATFV